MRLLAQSTLALLLCLPAAVFGQQDKPAEKPCDRPALMTLNDFLNGKTCPASAECPAIACPHSGHCPNTGYCPNTEYCPNTNYSITGCPTKTCPAAVCPAASECAVAGDCAVAEDCVAEKCALAEDCAVAEDSADDDCSDETECLADKIEHALEAIEHLNAAGMDDMAEQVHQQIADMRGDLLKRKIAELEQLQAEVASLRRATGQTQQIQVHVEIIELSLTKLRDLGLDISWLSGKGAKAGCEDCPRASTAPLVCDRAGVAGLIEALRQEKVVKVLAEPTLVTVNGRPSSCSVGGEIPMPIVNSDASIGVGFRKYGTQVDLVANLLGDHKVRLDIRPRCSELDTTTDITVQGIKVPGLRIREMDTGFEMELGKTAVLGGSVQDRVHKVVGTSADEFVATREEVQTVFLVTPELVEADAPKAAKAPARNSLRR